MAQTVLPSSINYAEQLPYLPSQVQNLTQVLQPINGSSFTQNQQIFIDIPSRGFIDPKSIYIRYKNVVVTATQGGVIGCPALTPFQRIDTFINSQMIDSVNDYNVVAHVWTNLNLGVNEKYGAQSAFGYLDATSSTVTLDELDGRYLSSATGETFFVSAPLPALMLTDCEKLIPAFATGGIRLVFTLDSDANVCSQGSGTSSETISNFELVYDMIDFGPEIEMGIKNQESIVIKSSGYSLNSTTIASGTSGQQSLVFNQRFASIRNAVFLSSGGKSAKLINGKFDSVNICGDGTYSLLCGGVQFPQAGPFNTKTNRQGIVQELRKATAGSAGLYDWSKSMAINAVEFAYDEDSTTSLSQPGKFYVGFSMVKCSGQAKAMLNGTSSQNSPITVQLNIGTATVTTKNCSLVLNYDAIIMIDPRTKMVRVNQ